MYYKIKLIEELFLDDRGFRIKSQQQLPAAYYHEPKAAAGIDGAVSATNCKFQRLLSEVIFVVACSRRTKPGIRQPPKTGFNVACLTHEVIWWHDE